MNMFISRVRYNMPNAYEYLNSNLTSYSLHRDMWSFFPGVPEGEKGPFLFSVKRDFIIMISEIKPVSPNSLWTIETRTYNPLMDRNQDLFYEMTFSPSYAKDGVKKSYIGSHLQPEDVAGPKKEQIQKLLLKWFQDRVQRLGFEVKTLEVLRDFNRKIPKPGKPYRFNEFSVCGTLKVKSVPKLRNSIFNGIGRAKRNGCGLLLLS